MDENEFLRSLEGETQQGADLVAGGEHLIRLKQQVGQTNEYPDLELEKKAGDLSDSLGTTNVNSQYASHWMPSYEDVEENKTKEICKGCGKRKIACMCMSEKMANAKAKLVEALKRVDPSLLVGMGLGATAGGIGTYLGSRPQKDTGKSKMEEEMEGRVNAQEASPPRGLLNKMHRSNTEMGHGYAQAFREHPVKAGLMGAVTGGIGGYSLARMAGGLIGKKGT